MSKTPGPDTEGRILDRATEARDRQAEATPSLSRELDTLFAAHEGRVYRLCLKMLGEPERARELTQETLLVAWERVSEFKQRSRFSTWIHGIAKNLCLNALRRKGESLTGDGILEADDPSVSVLQELTQSEREELLRSATEALTPEEQEVVWLRYADGIGQDDITRILDLPGSGARGVLQRCRRKLSRALREQLAAMGEGSSFFKNS